MVGREMATKPYEPPGIKYVVMKDGTIQMLVTAGPFEGWIARQHKDGPWVSLRPATPVDVERICATVWPRTERFNLMRPMRANIAHAPGKYWELSVCPKCGRECWRNPLEPRQLPSNVIAVCTECAFRGAVLWKIPSKEAIIKEPPE